MDNLEVMEKIGSDVRAKINNLFPDEKNVTLLLKKTIERLGGKFIGTDEPDYNDKVDGSLHINKIGDFVIKLPLYSSPLRDNFTVAHELGHYLIHYTGGENVTYTRCGTNSMEIEANRFAAAFLMPKKDFLEARKELNNSVSLLAARFQVPIDIVQDRMEYICD